MKRILFVLAAIACFITAGAQAVTVTQPNGGETLYSCQTYAVKWTATGASNFWTIDYSLNNGAIWTSVATNLSVNPSAGVYTYNWTIPFVASTNTLVRVRDYNDTLKQDQSNAIFTISYPITVLTPNGGETWQGLSSQTISWTAQGTSGIFALDYSVNNGSSWNNLANNVTGNNYIWSVPNNPSTQALVRVRDNSNSCQNDFSNSVFTISPATPILTSPNGGEVWTVNSTRSITWNSSTLYSTVNIDYSTDGGNTWTSIASAVSNSGSYSWLIPNTPSTNAKIRISNSANTVVSDVSDAPFTILMPAPQVTYPNGGEQLDVYTNIAITWNTATFVSPVRIEYSTNNGLTWSLITSSTTNNGSYSWQVPNLPGTQGLVRIFNTVYTSFGDTSNGTFTIRPIVNVTFPNAATDTLRACQSYSIQYQKTPASAISYFYFYYSTDGGITYNYFQSQNNNTNTSNSLSWSVPFNTNSSSGKIKIEAYNTGGSIIWADSSNALFPFVMPQNNITVTAPNGGINLNALTPYSITWTATNTSGTYDLYYCNTGTSNCNYIATVTGNNYTWTVPNNPSNSVFVRVRDANDVCKYDTSNTANTIIAAKPVLTAPNGGETWNVATTQNITWNPSTLYSNAKLEYSIDAGTSWNNITTSTSNSGSYAWTIPNAPTAQALVRISNVSNTAFADTSNAVFTISQPQITVTAPTAVTQLQVGQSYNIQWTTGPGVTNVKLEYSTDGGLTWASITNSTANDGSEAWTVPNIAGTQTVIRVSNAANLLVNGQSPQFTVLQPLIVTLPNGGETMVGCQNYNITLAKSPYIGNITLAYSTDGGLTWSNIATVTNNGLAAQTYSWTVPNITSTQTLVRAAAANNSAQRDSSDGLFAINPSQEITVTTPGAPVTLTPNQSYVISWTNTVNVSGVYVVQWRDSSNNLYNIATNVTGNNYIWAVPNTPGGNNRFRVYDQNNTCRFDLSDTTFSIRPFSPQLLLPNGGEQLEVGTSYNIDWNENTYYNNLRIEYSTNNGLTWNLLANNYSNANGVYPWTVPNLPSTNCLVRVLTYNNLQLGDTSNAVFTIKRPLVVTRPLSNDTLVDCNNITIQWDKTSAAGTSTNNSIYYSSDNGLSWNAIATSVQGVAGTSQSYSWTSTLPGPGSYIIRVINNAGYGDTSDAPFTIIPFNGITIVTPNGGQTWGAGTSQLIGWNAQAGISAFNLAYSTNGGSSFNTIATGQAGYSYSWTLPNVNSSNVIVRVTDNANNCRYDLSNAPLTIVPLQPVLTAPNGGEVWNVNSTQTITWDAATFHSAVKLAYSIDNGTNWILITNSTSNSGSYAWTIPNGPSATCLVRAANVQDTTWYDISNTVFTIRQPKPVLTYPNGGEVLDPGSTYSITWDAASVSSTTVRLEISTNNGLTWSIITGSANNTGSYNSFVPTGSNVALTQCLVRIVNLSFPSLMDTSNALFTINPYVKVTYPNLATDTIRNCQTVNVTFRKYPQGNGTYYGFYSSDNGANWNYFGSANTSTGNTNYSIAFTMPNTVAGNSFKIKISANSDPNMQAYVYQDSSDAGAPVVYPPIDITVTAPNGGENLNALTNYTVTWTNGPSVSGTYRLRYFSPTLGTATIASNVTGNNYIWSVPNNPSNDWKVRVEDQNNSCKIDSGNNFFTITAATPVITSPNGGEFWAAASGQTITWTASTFYSSNVKIEYSLDNGATWILLTASTANDGAEAWTVPNVQSATALIRISTIGTQVLSDVSNAVFTVGYPTPVLTAPTNTPVEYSQPLTIAWNTSSINSTTVRLEYSIDSMQTWNLITTTNTANGSYAWTAPNVTTNNLFVRAMNTLNLNVWDANNAPIAILRPMRLTSFNTQQNLVGCQTVTFSFSRSPYISESARVQYSLDGGNTWNSAGSSVSAGAPVAQSTTWSVPNINATNVMFRAIFTSTTSYADTADVATHTITADYPITIASPNTNVSLVPGQNFTISWSNTANVSGIFELQLYKNGSFVQTIASNVTGNNYIWSVPNNPGNGAFSLRIYDSNASCKFDTSDVRFTIIPNTPLLTSPNGGETWWALQTQNITWNAATFYNNVRLDYSLDSGLTWINIASSITNDGSEAWTIPANTPYTTKALVKISDATNLALFDVSNAVFTLKPMVRILTPNGGATLGACTNSSISFEHSPFIYSQGYTFTIQYTLNNGVSYTNLTTTQNPSSGSTVTYNYTLPNSSTLQYAVKVYVTQNSAYSDISDSVTIIRPAVTIVQPNFGGVLQVGSSYQIKWSSDGISNLYNLYYSTNGPTGTYNVIQLNYNTSTNQYLWTVPNAPSTNCYIVIQDATASCKADTSNVAFTISNTANAVAITAPNGGDTLTGCQNYNITWTEPGTPAGQYNIAYSADAGATFNTIVSNYNTTSGSYTWVVPNTVNSANVLVRVALSSAPTTFDLSNALLAITTGRVTAIPDTTICQGNSVQLFASGGNNIFSWTPSLTLNNANIPNPIATPTLTTTYTATSNNAGCIISDTARVTVIPGGVVTAGVSISVAPGTGICSGTNVTFTATPVNGGTTPAYQWKKNGNNVGLNSPVYATNSIASNDVITCIMTSNASCVTGNPATSNAVTMTVFPTVTPNVTIAASSTSICTGDSVTFTATPANGGGSPAYQWKVNGTNVGTNSNTFTTSALNNNDNITVELTSSANCAIPVTVSSNTIQVTVNQYVTPAVTISTAGTTVCSGQSVQFSAAVTNAGASPTYQWKKNNSNVGTGLSTYTTSALANGDIITCVLTSNAACPNPAQVTSNQLTISVVTSATPAVSIMADSTAVCAGTVVHFTATPTNGGSTPAYQWKINGNNTGTNSATYSSNALANGDAVSVVMTSNFACASPTTATSNVVTLTVNPTSAPSVSINTASTTICSGAGVTFTATAANAGNTPAYQWKINGNNVGGNSNTYSTATLNNADVVTCVVTSSSGCAVPNFATSNALTITVNSNAAPTITINTTNNNICAGSNMVFTSSITNGGSAPTYQWKVNGNNAGSNSASFSSNALANNDVVTAVLTSNAQCATPNTATSNAITATVNPVIAPSVSITAGSTTVCAGVPVTFTATPANGGSNPAYQWKINGNNAGTNGNSFTTSALGNNDVVSVVLTSNATCISPATATSNVLNMTVNPAVTPAIVISASATTICTGTNITFTAAITNGGATPAYQWKVNGNNAAGNSATFSSAALVSGDVVTCQLTSSAPCASVATANSNSITITVNPVVTPSVSIAASGNNICAGTPVTFTATPGGAGGAPTYQWKLNGNSVGTNSPTYTNAALANNDVVSAILTSSAACAAPASATSNSITMAVMPAVVPSVSISTGATTICAGTSVTFNATPANGGGTPVYQWKVNGNNAGTNSATFTTNTLNNNDLVSVVLTSNAACASPVSVTSTGIAITVNPLTAPTISISASATTACTGTNITFNATVANAGSTPGYQWKVNGNNAGTNSPSFSSAALNNNDVVTCQLTSSNSCAGTTTVTSNSVSITITTAVTPLVSISASATNICAGQGVTFTATPSNGGTAPAYQWMINGNNAGSNSATFTTTALNNNDVVTCLLTSNANCAAPGTATSNSVTVMVGSNATPTISISTPATTVCAGAPVTFTAAITNGGSSPVYQWQINGLNAGTNAATFTTSALPNGAVITCGLTSNAACVTQNTVGSNSLILTVNPVVTPAISINASATSICSGTAITFTATPANGGNAPQYQWLVNGSPVGTSSATYITSALNNTDMVTCQLTTSAACATQPTATSNSIAVTVNAQVVPTVAISAGTNNICSGTPVMFTATAANTGTAPVYQWMINGVNAGSNSDTLVSSTLNDNDVVTLRLTSNAVCAVPDTAASAPVTMVVSAAVTPTISITGASVCAGSVATFTAAITNGGTAPVYQWQVNGNNVGSNANTYSSALLNTGDIVTCRLTSNANCAAPATVSSNQYIVNLLLNVTPTVAINTASTTVCSGAQVTFAAVATNGGSNPVYQWKLNGNIAGANSNTFTTAVSNGDVVSAELTSNAQCVTGSLAVSNNITMAVSGSVIPAATIIADNNNICSGSTVNFTATVTNEGAAPAYQWKVNGISAGANSPAFSTSTLADGDTVTLELTSDAVCANPAVVTSNTIAVVVTPVTQPTVTIAASANPVCSGSSVTFTATAANAGATPVYQWKVNGNNAGVSSSTFTSAALNDADVVSCIVTSTETCTQGVTAPSNSITLTIAAALVPAVTINTGSTTICPGTALTFTAVPVNGGATPAYQWKLNGNNAGNGTNTYSNAALNNGDVITVELTSSESCASPATATASPVTITVSNAVTPAVTITVAPGNTICEGTAVTFTAVPVNGGTTPVYNWKINGTSTGAGGATYTTATLNNNDVVTVELTSNESCASPQVAQSGSINMVVNAIPAVPVTSANSPLCEGSMLQLSCAAVTGAGYIWSGPGNFTSTDQNPVISNPGPANSGNYQVVVTANGCSSQPGTVTVVINARPAVPVITQSGNVLTSSSTINNQWYLNNNPIAGASQQSYTVNQQGWYVVAVTNNQGCTGVSDSLFAVPTGIGEVSIEDAISIFPNPFATQLNINIAQAVSDISRWSITITDELGKTVYEKAQADYNNTVDLSQRPAAMYFVTVRSGLAIKTYRIIKHD